MLASRLLFYVIQIMVVPGGQRRGRYSVLADSDWTLNHDSSTLLPHVPRPKLVSPAAESHLGRRWGDVHIAAISPQVKS